MRALRAARPLRAVALSFGVRGRRGERPFTAERSWGRPLLKRPSLRPMLLGKSSFLNEFGSSGDTKFLGYRNDTHGGRKNMYRLVRFLG